MKKLLLLSFILISIFVVCKKDEGELPTPPTPKNAIDLLPKDNEISGWTKPEAARIAETGDQLTAIIDGEAVPYINNNFKEAVFQKYSGTIGGNAVPMDVRIFDMRDTVNTRKVYKDVASGQEIPWSDPRPGVEARIDETGLFSYRVDFWEERFFIRIIIDDKTTAGLDVAKAFANNISAAMKE